MYAATEAFPYECGNHKRTGTFGNGAAPTLLPEKITQCPKARLLFNRIQIALKQKPPQFSRVMELLSLNFAYSMTLIDSLVKSEPYKRN